MTANEKIETPLRCLGIDCYPAEDDGERYTYKNTVYDSLQDAITMALVQREHLIIEKSKPWEAGHIYPPRE